MPRITPTAGRIVYAFSPDWEGHRPGQITSVAGDGPDAPVNVNVQLDAVLDERLIIDNGGELLTTLRGLPVLEPGTPGHAGPRLEWMPYQAGQAAKPAEVIGTAASMHDLAVLRDRTERALRRLADDDAIDGTTFRDVNAIMAGESPSRERPRVPAVPAVGTIGDGNGAKEPRPIPDAMPPASVVPVSSDTGGVDAPAGDPAHERDRQPEPAAAAGEPAPESAQTSGG